MVGLSPRRFRNWLVPRAWKLRRLYFVHVWKMDIGPGTRISFSAKLDLTNPAGIHIGSYTAVNFGAVIVTHDYVNIRHSETRIGSYCQIGARSFIFSGITIGDHCIVVPGSVVMKDVPSGSLVAGNPARVMEAGIKTDRYGVRAERLAEVRRGEDARAQ